LEEGEHLGTTVVRHDRTREGFTTILIMEKGGNTPDWAIPYEELYCVRKRPTVTPKTRRKWLNADFFTWGQTGLSDT